MAIVTVGIDLAKNVFAVHGVDEWGKPALVCPQVARAKLLELVAKLPPCLIGFVGSPSTPFCLRATADQNTGIREY